jgi:hypothetical protein
MSTDCRYHSQTQQLSITELSALYDRTYDIADRLFKKYNPCNIRVEGGKICCLEIIPFTRQDKLCCKGCSFWQNGCTVKCLGCKLYTCGDIKICYPTLYNKLSKLRRVAYKLNLPENECRLPKEKWLKVYYGYKEKSMQL